jgi:hypothetical protein
VAGLAGRARDRQLGDDGGDLGRSLVRKDASLVDRVWGLAFVVAAWTYAHFADGADGADLAGAGAGHDLGAAAVGYITWRNWGDGEDKRYQAMRERNPTRSRSAASSRCSCCRACWRGSSRCRCWPRRLRRAGGLIWLDYLAVAVWLVGFVFEAGGDWQLSRFLADPATAARSWTGAVALHPPPQLLRRHRGVVGLLPARAGDRRLVGALGSAR